MNFRLTQWLRRLTLEPVSNKKSIYSASNSFFDEIEEDARARKLLILESEIDEDEDDCENFDLPEDWDDDTVTADFAKGVALLSGKQEIDDLSTFKVDADEVIKNARSQKEFLGARASAAWWPNGLMSASREGLLCLYSSLLFTKSFFVLLVIGGSLTFFSLQLTSRLTFADEKGSTPPTSLKYSATDVVPLGFITESLHPFYALALDKWKVRTHESRIKGYISLCNVDAIKNIGLDWSLMEKKLSSDINDLIALDHEKMLSMSKNSISSINSLISAKHLNSELASEIFFTSTGEVDCIKKNFMPFLASYNLKQSQINDFSPNKSLRITSGINHNLPRNLYFYTSIEPFNKGLLVDKRMVALHKKISDANAAPTTSASFENQSQVVLQKKLVLSQKEQTSLNLNSENNTMSFFMSRKHLASRAAASSASGTSQIYEPNGFITIERQPLISTARSASSSNVGSMQPSSHLHSGPN